MTRAALLSTLLVVFLSLCISARAAPSAGEKALVKAILAANSTVKKVTLTADITLTAPLPALQYNATLIVQGACKGRRCVISGGGKVSGFSCVAGGAVVLQDLVLTRFRGGAINGGCVGVGVPYGLVARRVTFEKNYNPASGGAIYVDFVGAQITSCEFIQNSAAKNGGAIQTDAGFYLNLYNTTFYRNTAGGVGGAVSGVVSSIKETTFDLNTAGGGGGGALYSTNTNGFFVSKSSFTRNTAKKLGGALYLSPSGLLSPYWLCNTTFRHNAAATKQSGDVYAAAAPVGSVYTPAIIYLCGGTSPVWALNNGTVVKTCVGCTGCSQKDCNNKGACVEDPVDANTSCVCKPHYTSNSYCVQCDPGYAVTAKCRQCVPGYNAVKNSSPIECKPCSAIAASGILPDPSKPGAPIIGGGPASSYQQCAALCAASQAGTVSPVLGSTTQSCELWAYFDATAPAGCKRTCVLWNLTGACANGTVVHKPKLGLYVGEFDNGSCGP